MPPLCGMGHMRRGGGWLFFNDAQVAVSSDPPLEAGYMYLDKRAT